MGKQYMIAKKVDINQKKIVDTLRKLGCSVFVTSSIGQGFPDLVVGIRKETYLVEIKTEKGTYTKTQLKFYANWRGGNVITLRSIEDAIEWHSLCT